jgi:hypothetical protein
LGDSIRWVSKREEWRPHAYTQISMPPIVYEAREMEYQASGEIAAL